MPSTSAMSEQERQLLLQQESLEEQGTRHQQQHMQQAASTSWNQPREHLTAESDVKQVNGVDNDSSGNYQNKNHGLEGPSYNGQERTSNIGQEGSPGNEELDSNSCPYIERFPNLYLLVNAAVNVLFREQQQNQQRNNGAVEKANDGLPQESRPPPDL
ncbi:hypothetical protein M0802_016789 [Mischocyttarus mexicanus]|nr:hypothetical protein M0802_016789 [Mischocyttarus mexicanus]